MANQRGAGVRESYDRIAEEYARRLFHELERKPLDRELLLRFARATRGGPVWELGCGPGQVARYLQDAGSQVSGLDLSPAMIAEARRLNPDVAFVEGDMMALPLEDGAAAGLVAFYSIVNIPEERLAAVFAEMARVLRPGGLLLLAFHTGGAVLPVREMFGRTVEMEFYFFPAEAIAEKLRAAGLTVEEVVERGPYAPEVEHQSHRAYVFAQKPGEARVGG